MKANELRIGNLVMIKENGSFFVVDELGMSGSDNHIHCVAFKKSESIIKSWQAEPIPLSEEILLKVGFEKLGIVFQNDYLMLIYECDYFYHHTAFGKVNIKHLHQLQNLYFAICCQELNTSVL